MGGRGTFAVGNNVGYQYKTVDKIEDVKVLQGTGKLHDLPVEAHSSEMYIKVYKDGNVQQLRVYDKEHYLTLEIAYHREPSLSNSGEPILHYHVYDRNLNRSEAKLLDKEMYDKYKKYLKGRKWYD